MAFLAKILGVACLLAACLAVLDIMWRILSVDWSASQDGSWGEVGFGIAVLIMAAEAAVALLLATVGVAAYVVGDLAEGAAADSRARRARWEAASEYGARRT